MCSAASPLLISPRPGEVDEDAPHQAGAKSIEVSAVLPVNVLDIYQAKIHLMNQGCGLQCLARLLTGHISPRQAVEFVINQRHQLQQCGLVARRPGVQQACNVVP